jgi:hypothetical protein
VASSLGAGGGAGGTAAAMPAADGSWSPGALDDPSAAGWCRRGARVRLTAAMPTISATAAANIRVRSPSWSGRLRSCRRRSTMVSVGVGDGVSLALAQFAGGAHDVLVRRTRRGLRRGCRRVRVGCGPAVRRRASWRGQRIARDDGAVTAAIGHRTRVVRARNTRRARTVRDEGCARRTRRMTVGARRLSPGRQRALRPGRRWRARGGRGRTRGARSKRALLSAWSRCCD